MPAIMIKDSKENSTVSRLTDIHSDEKSRGIAAYLGLAIGDALGATVEFMTASEIQHMFGTHKDIVGGGWLRLKPGQVTDDTAMSLALGSTIIKTQRINPFDIAHSFSDWLKSKPIDIGNTVRRGIQNFRITNDPISPENEHSAGNGACMRCLPVAIATLNRPNKDVQLANQFQSHVTHHNQTSDAGTQCVINMIQMGIKGVVMDTLFTGPVAELINKYPKFNFYSRLVTNPSSYIVDTLQAVFQSLSVTDSFESCLIDVVNRGGDADTTGAIAGMIAGSVYGLDDIPQRWLDSLDPTIRKQCEDQASDLFKLGQNIHLSDSNPLI